MAWLSRRRKDSFVARTILFVAEKGGGGSNSDVVLGGVGCYIAFQ